MQQTNRLTGDGQTDRRQTNILLQRQTQKLRCDEETATDNQKGDEYIDKRRTDNLPSSLQNTKENNKRTV